MAPYRFKLESVRRVRQARRDGLRGELADAYTAAEKLADERRRVGRELAAVRARLAEASRSPQLDVNRLLDAQRYELILKAQLQDLANKEAMVAQEIERRRDAVAEAEREVKVTDALDRAGRERHRTEAARAESKQMDELAGVLWTRNR